MSITTTIISNLLHNEAYARRVLPYLKPIYFEDAGARHLRVLFAITQEYYTKYGVPPTAEAIEVELDRATKVGFSDEVAKHAIESLRFLKPDDGTSQEWLLERTEDFCKRQAIYQGVLRTLEIQQGEAKGVPLDAITDVWREAMSVSFDDDLGHDYLADAEKRYDAYKKQERRIPFDLPILNQITRGGLPSKSLSVIMAPTGIGKSQFMGHLAAHQLMMGKNVVYFTLEMSAMEQIGERIDSNLMGVNVKLVEQMPKDLFMSKVETMRKKTLGRLVVKEYPTASAGAHHFRKFIDELRLKRGFQPDIIYVDYINLCLSSRVKSGSDANSYTIIKFIAEELRGLAMELDVPIVTATQTNRGGLNNSDTGMDDVAESFGLPQTCDFMLALISSEELEGKGQIVVKQLKNRWTGVTENSRFVLGIDRARMRLFELSSATFNSPTPKGAGLDTLGFR